MNKTLLMRTCNKHLEALEITIPELSENCDVMIPHTCCRVTSRLLKLAVLLNSSVARSHGLPAVPAIIRDSLINMLDDVLTDALPPEEPEFDDQGKQIPMELAEEDLEGRHGDDKEKI